jgi:hypothetical protein
LRTSSLSSYSESFSFHKVVFRKPTGCFMWSLLAYPDSETFLAISRTFWMRVGQLPSRKP